MFANDNRKISLYQKKEKMNEKTITNLAYSTNLI